jgi:hypothetical protein
LIGKLSKNTILQGFAALKELAEFLDKPSGNINATCDELTGRYYSIIPHAFGRTRPPTIRNQVDLKKVRYVFTVERCNLQAIFTRNWNLLMPWATW